MKKKRLVSNKRKNRKRVRKSRVRNKRIILSERTKNIISVILPLVSIFIIALTLEGQSTGFAMYEGRKIYGLNGSINITLEENIPADSYIRVKIDEYIIKINLIEFLEKSGKPYEIYKGRIIANNVTYGMDFPSFGIIRGFYRGKHKIIVEIIHEDSVLYGDEKIIDI